MNIVFAVLLGALGVVLLKAGLAGNGTQLVGVLNSGTAKIPAEITPPHSGTVGGGGGGSSTQKVK